MGDVCAGVPASFVRKFAFMAALAVAAPAAAVESKVEPSAPAVAVHPNALVAIDQNRHTVVDRIVAEWGDALDASGAGLTQKQLRALLDGLRADQLLAASLAGTLEGLRNVVASALTVNAPVADALIHAKAIGDPADDLVYTPIAPCRILDSRGAAGGALQAGQTRNWLAANPGGNFGVQGGAATNCGIAVKPAAVLVNFTVANTTGAANFLVAWPFGVTRPNASVLNWTAAGQQIANAVVVPLCTSACASDFSTYASAQTDLIGDVLGYFAPPGTATPSGSGTANALAKWTAATTLGGSAVVEVGGHVGIGTTNPVNLVQIGSTPPFFSGNHLAIGNGSSGMSFAQTGTASTWYSSTSFSLMPNGGIGQVGIGTQSPQNRLQIGDTPAFSQNDLAIGNGSKGMSFTQSSSASTWYSNTDFALMPNAGGSGRVGIGTQAPANTLQVGSVGSTGVGGNHIAFGNGTAASGITQTSSAVQWFATTDIALMPQANGQGHVGINTTAPAYPLTVESGGPFGDGFAYFKADSNNNPIVNKCSFCSAIISIRASNNIWAMEFDAASDARIKDVVGVSDAARDLDTLLGLQVVDYTLRDRVAYGSTPFKKLVAQQVERVYPQVVGKHVGVVPNVYRTASKVVGTERGLMLHFDDEHRLTAQAKRIRLMSSGDSTMRVVGIVAVPTARDVVIDVKTLAGDKVFVYGEEVDDFRTVDYEGLTALNISATQALAKALARERADAAAGAALRDARIAELADRLELQAARIAELERQADAMAVLTRQAAEMAATTRPVAEPLEGGARAPMAFAR